jgi:glycosyltransferase involved in cell wall biosynthesis
MPEQLHSIAVQTRLPDELVICDDRSSDATGEIVEEFAARAPFPVRLIVNSENLGTTKNFEKAISACRGDVIVLSDQDDSWYANRLQAAEDVLIAHPDVGAVFTDADIVDDELKPLGYRLLKTAQFNSRLRRQVDRGNAFEALLAHNFVTGATMAFRAEFLPLVAPIPSLWTHDGWIAILISAVASVICVDRPLIKYRQHSSQQIGARRRSIGAHIASTQACNNYERYRQMEEQYRLVYERLQEAFGSRIPQRRMALLQAKIRHMSRRTELSRNHLRRVPAIAAELVLNRYRQFGYGWRDVIRDLLVNLEP